jgi:hypothetical protein
VVFRRRSDAGLPHDAPLWLWPVRREETPHRDESIASLERYLVSMVAREGEPLRRDSTPPSDAWSLQILVRGLPIREAGDSDSVDATAMVFIRNGTKVTDMLEVTEEIRTYYADYLPWRLARKIADVIGQRRNGW